MDVRDERVAELPHVVETLLGEVPLGLGDDLLLVGPLPLPCRAEHAHDEGQEHRGNAAHQHLVAFHEGLALVGDAGWTGQDRAVVQESPDILRELQG